MKIRGRIFMIDDDELIISMLSRSLKKAGYDTRVQTSAKDALNNIIEWHPDLVMLDINLGDNKTGLDILAEIRKEKFDTQVVMLTADDSAESAITAMKLGAADYLTKPFNVEEVKIVIKSVLEKAKLREEVDYLRKNRLSCVEQDMVGNSPVVKATMDNAEKVAAAKVPTILITGESGTGKEVLARHIYNYRYLNDPGAPEYIPYISVNCTALPDNLIESELFGHTKYAFTDAKKEKKGLFELADGGTLLLDEIGDMRFDLQSKLLRVLEERTVRRLGGKVDVPIDV
ncbi:MAG: sigma-54-dependent Fis family transcriptional regulator, partial [Desulfobulbaceae bacterium]|nr:sigma-54-dependent Fis family transcriptional regulator [Candidatus Desulfobia pelagia]